MSDPYLIKKYSSRRLYDVEAGAFVTLDEIDHLVQQGRRIRVVDADGRDITHSILLQIFAGHEAEDNPLLSVDLLHDLLRLYNNAMQGPFGRYLEQGMQLLHKQQKLWQSLPQTFGSDPGNAWQDIFQQQMGLWEDAQQVFLQGLGATARTAPPAAGKDRGDQSEESTNESGANRNHG